MKKFIVGVGNPGQIYVNTRHNAGFMVLDQLAMTNAVSWQDKSRRKFLHKIAWMQALVSGHECSLIKPMTFVNNTGQVVGALLDSGDVLPSDILVVCDDVNLDFGKLRYRDEGTSGGHHGLESVEKVLKSQRYPRLRVGIRNEHMPRELSEYVLGPFNDNERVRLGVVIDTAAKVCDAWIREGSAGAVKTLSVLQNITYKGDK